LIFMTFCQLMNSLPAAPIMSILSSPWHFWLLTLF